MSKIETEALASACAFLFVPGDRPERFSKALASGADFVIIDLEDAVAVENKTFARQAVRSLDEEVGRNLLVRINAVSVRGFESDVEACLSGKVSGLVLPKIETANDLDRVAALSGGLPVVPLVESARGIANLTEIAAHFTVARLAFGSIDYRIDLAIPRDGLGLAAARSEIVLRSRLAGLPSPIDGVTLNFRDEAPLMEDVKVSRSFGFGAKLAIHPSQVGLIKRGFRPSDEEIAWARRILAAVDRAGDGVGSISAGGEMIDRPVILRATSIIELAGPTAVA